VIFADRFALVSTIGATYKTFDTSKYKYIVSCFRPSRTNMPLQIGKEGGNAQANFKSKLFSSTVPPLLLLAQVVGLSQTFLTYYQEQTITSTQRYLSVDKSCSKPGGKRNVQGQNPCILL